MTLKHEQLDLELHLSHPVLHGETRERAQYTSRPLRIKVEPVVTVRVVLHGMSGTCTKCGATKPASEFGLLTDDHLKGVPNLITVRNQPQCKACR